MSRLTNLIEIARRRWKWLTGGAAVIVTAAIAIGLGSSDTQSAVSGNLVAVVTRGALVISTSERGDVDPEKKKLICNELRWQTTIKKVIPDGTIVNEGDLIVEMDCKELTDAISKQEVEIATAKNQLLDANATCQMKKLELANKVEKANQLLIDAQEDLKRYDKGELPVSLNQADSDVMLAQQDLTLAQRDLEFMKMVNQRPEMKDDKPYSEKEIDAKQLEADRKKAAVENSQSKLDMLKTYDDPKDRRKYEGAIRDAKLELERATIDFETQVKVAENTVQTRKSMLVLSLSAMELLKTDAAKLVVKADRTGLVIYKAARHWDPQALAVGDKVNSGQQMMIIPDMESLRISTKVPEALKDKVSLDMEAFVRLDVKPDMVLNGRVQKIAPVPDSGGNWWGKAVKVYTVNVVLDKEQTALLKPEMTAKVEIILGRLDNVLHVPVAAVFSEQEQSFCWKITSASRKKVPVKVGGMNDTSIELISGLAEGDKVLLAPPADEGSDPSDKTAKPKPPAAPKEKGKKP